MRLKSAGRRPDTQNLPGLDGCVEPFQRNGAKICKLELIADKTFRHRVNDQLIGLCQCLEASGKIGVSPNTDRSLAVSCPMSSPTTT